MIVVCILALAYTLAFGLLAGILRLGGNQLQGDFPIFLTRNRNLIELDLERNRLKGTIPPEIGSLSRLERLCLGSCDFEGPIPDTIGQLTKLELLELQENRIGNQFGQENTPSKLPTILGALTNLSTYNNKTSSLICRKRHQHRQILTRLHAFLYCRNTEDELE